jgi:hypothetical protein
MISECIEIKQTRLTRRFIVPQSINFHLNKAYLHKIDLAQLNKQKLFLTSTLLADLRYYALLAQHNCLQSGLIFRTYYQEQEQEIAILESVISLDGKIIQKIRGDYLSSFSLLQNLTSAHYWLITEMLQQLPLMSKNNFKWLSWGLALPITILIGYFLFFLFDITFSIHFLMLIIVFLLLKKQLKFYLFYYLYNIVLHQLLFGIFAEKSNKRKIGFALLKFFN